MTVIDSTKKTFGEELTAVRKVRMGRSSLAEASGISLSLISQVESGKIATPLFKTIYPLISALGLSMGDPEYDQLLVPGMRDNWAKYKDNYSSDLILDRRSMELKMLRLFLNYRPEYLITEGHINLSPRAIYEAEEKTRLTQKHAVQIYKALGLAQEAKRYPWGNNPYFALSEDPSANRKYGRPKKQITVDKKEEVITEPNNNDEILNLIVTRAKDNPTLTATLTLSGGRKMVIDDISDSTIESVIGRLINPLGRND
jgi:transcriptional regulator with XRE-family HTH domain